MIQPVGRLLRRSWSAFSGWRLVPVIVWSDEPPHDPFRDEIGESFMYATDNMGIGLRAV